MRVLTTIVPVTTTFLMLLAAAPGPAQAAPSAATQPVGQPATAFITPIGTSGLTGDQVLAEFAKTQDAQSRVIFKYRVTSHSLTNVPDRADFNGDGGVVGEVRTDAGMRWYSERRPWGVGFHNIAEAQAPVERLLAVNGKLLKWSPEVSVTGNQTLIELHNYGPNYHFGLGSVENDVSYALGHYGRAGRVDAVLRNWSGTKFTEERGPDDRTRLICAQTASYGTILKVWFDPSHGFNMAKMDYVWTLPPDYKGRIQFQSHHQTWEVSKFALINGTWVAMEADIKGEGRMPTPGQYARGTGHMVRSDVILNPDFDALGSFSTDTVPDGASVQYWELLAGFRIAPEPQTLTEGQLAAARDALKAGKLILGQKPDPANPTPDYLWVPLAPDVNPTSAVVGADYQNWTYLLVCNQPSQIIKSAAKTLEWTTQGRTRVPSKWEWNLQFHLIKDAAGRLALRYDLDAPHVGTLAGLTSANVGKYLALIANHKVIWLSVIKETMPGQGVIPGYFSAAAPSNGSSATTQPGETQGAPTDELMPAGPAWPAQGDQP